MRVPQTAGFDPGFELLPHQEVKFQPVAINTTGYMYVWVSNESEATKVWFDDLSIVHHQSIVTQATDYGVWGEVLRGQKTNVLDLYRYGYQGQFAEKDEETGWNHFEAREYNPVIGRWQSVDFQRQFYSPYLAFSNNPIYYIDIDGRFSIPPWKWRAFGMAALNATGGVLEVAAGGSALAASGGTTSVLSVLVITDGISRATLGFNNALMALAAENEKQFNDLMLPSNLGGIAGAVTDHVLDNKEKQFQTLGTFANDVASIVAGRNFNVKEFPSFIQRMDELIFTIDAGMVLKDGISIINSYKDSDFIMRNTSTYSNFGNIGGATELREIVITSKN